MSIIQKRIKILQGYDDSRKKTWLIGLSGVSMVAVIGIWLVYINISTPAIYRPKPEEKPMKEKNTEEAGIAAIFKRGFGRAYDAMESKLAVLSLGFERALETAREEIKKSRDYSIEGENLDLRRPENQN